jgi:hypothetical protein
MLLFLTPLCTLVANFCVLVVAKSSALLIAKNSALLLTDYRCGIKGKKCIKVSYLRTKKSYCCTIKGNIRSKFATLGRSFPQYTPLAHILK